ncbi:uncharacterized protein LOC116618476 [Nematostella vectensis]|uniref:uncharacterized protein LOC116618476 n=1 Tax=Nematostella vectensis TaxID=45351 RepID=UPI002077135E|nr:uncharacterized protein LOC116618476 [Nematostella vectensis]
MDRLADENFTYLLLRVNENMTLEEKSQFGFCLRAILPASVLERQDLLEMFRHLEQQDELSPRNLRQLKKFLEFKQRRDLLKAVREFEVGLGLMDIFQMYMNFPSSITETSHSYDEAEFVFQWLKDRREKLVGVESQTNGTILENHAQGLPTQLSWDIVLNRIAVVFADVENKNIQARTLFDEGFGELVTWVTKNGGMRGMRRACESKQ